MKIGIVTGDNILSRLDDFVARGASRPDLSLHNKDLSLRNMDTGEPLASILPRVRSANVYLGAFPIVRRSGRARKLW